MALIKKAEDASLPPGTKETLEKFWRTCETCQRYSCKQHLFRVSMPHDDCVFNRSVGMDIMKIEGLSGLQIIDLDTKFAAASFLNKKQQATSGKYVCRNGCLRT